MPTYNEVHGVMEKACVVCHSAKTIAQKNISFDSPEEVKSHAQQIYTQVVQLKKMPFGNPAGLTDAERDMFKRWYEGGAPTAP